MDEDVQRLLALIVRQQLRIQDQMRELDRKFEQSQGRTPVGPRVDGEVVDMLPEGMPFSQL